MTVSDLLIARSRHGQQSHAPALAALGDATAWAGGTLREWRRRSRERAELAALDDRTLHDIGLTRSDAIYLSSKPFWRE